MDNTKGYIQKAQTLLDKISSTWSRETSTLKGIGYAILGLNETLEKRSFLIGRKAILYHKNSNCGKYKPEYIGEPVTIMSNPTNQGSILVLLNDKTLKWLDIKSAKIKIDAKSNMLDIYPDPSSASEYRIMSNNKKKFEIQFKIDDEWHDYTSDASYKEMLFHVKDLQTEQKFSPENIKIMEEENEATN